MSHEAALRDIAGKLPVRPNARTRQVWIAFMVIGVAAFAFLLATNPLRAWGIVGDQHALLPRDRRWAAWRWRPRSG